MEIVTIDADAYHADRAIGSSGLKKLKQSPLHYWAAYLDPEREPVDSQALRIGRAWHCAVFEPEHFGDRYAANHDAHAATKRAGLLSRLLAGDLEVGNLTALPEGLSLTTKEGKALVAQIELAGKVAVADEDHSWLLTWLPRLRGRDVLSQSNIDAVLKMADVMRSHPISRVLFSKYAGIYQIETSIFSVCPETGVRVKVRPDLYLPPCEDFVNGLIVDGKSTTDASAEGFARQVWNLDYGLQAAFYTAVIGREYKTAGRPAFLWAACEKEAPHASAYYAAGEDLLAHYDKEISRLMRLYKHCSERDTWPGYPTTVQPLSLPVWAQKLVDAV